MLTVEALEAAHAGAWDAYVHGNPAATCYHQYVWRRVIQEAFGHRTDYLAVRRNGDICGVLPLCFLDSRLFGQFIVSLPFFNYGGVLADDPQAETALLDHARTLAEQLGASHMELRMTRPLPEGWPAKTHKVSMLLPLPQSADVLWDGFKAKLRSQIRRPEREGMTIQFGRHDQLDHFYTVFARNMRDLGTPVYGKGLFESILERYAQSHIAVVSYQGQPVSAGFLTGYRDTLEIPWASTIRDFNRLSPNMMLYWQVLKWACERGYRRFDFGRSSADSGTYRFKRQWGAEAAPFYWCYWTRDGQALPEVNPNNPKYRWPIMVWKKLPVALTRLMGPSLVKHLP